ncbi:hypothetical protein OQZ33_21540 [Pedobacter sp. MC2016-05]|uniref:hypothetical protein n=1 Tax=Pedobacter sp. MC2016-05 TaxID=2994474 RepID=UPI0022462DCD|nr:hypothetical protein [Pedobacter sp. MC2016-05]MCX2476932.1 hypothetical protein [Pedobacter sp. MC2016-05]
MTVSENRKISNNTGRIDWLPTLCVGAFLPCVVGLCGPSEAGDRSTRAFFMEENLQDPVSEFLNMAITDLAVSEGFMLRSKLMGFSTIGEIVKANLVEVSAKEDYSQRWYFELVSILDRRGLLHLISR